jgi:anti-sigma-K factor RskA
MRISRIEPHTLAGAFALDALTEADRARFERHLARCPQCASELSGLREATARLAAVAAAEPPAGLIERALAAAARTRQLPPLVPRIPPSRRTRGAAVASADGRRRQPAARRRRAWVPALACVLAGAVVAVAVILGLAARGAQHQVQQDQMHSKAIAAVLSANDAHLITARMRSGGVATIVMSGHEHALVFAATGLRALPASSGYELWLMGPGGDKPAGMLPAPRQGLTGPVLASGLTAGDRLGLTVEPAGGSSRPDSKLIALISL